MMKNYRSWVKSEGQRFVEAEQPEFEGNKDAFGGKSDSPDFLAWADEQGRIVAFAKATAEKWSLADVQFVISNSPNADKQAVSKDQAVDAVVRDLGRAVKQAWKRR